MTDQANSTPVEAPTVEDKSKDKDKQTPDKLRVALAKKELNAKIVYNKEMLKLNTDKLTTGRDVTQERLTKLMLLNDFIEKELDNKAKAALAGSSKTPASK